MTKFFTEIKQGTSTRTRRRKGEVLLTKLRRGELENIKLVSKPKVGRMYQFIYSAKTKDTLPYWDKNPLIVVIDVHPGGFLGLNLHYLSPRVRLILLKKLFSFATEKKFTKKTRLRLSWSLLSKSIRYKEVRPTVKRYLSGHVRSKLAQIHPHDWEKVIFIPTQNFVGASARSVYAKSRRIYTKR